MTWALRPHRAEDYMTKITAVGPNRNHPCPRWLQFLDEITGDDQELVDYLQRVCGYCLTSSVAEHVLFFAHGGGANGKSTFVNLLMWILGDLCRGGADGDVHRTPRRGTSRPSWRGCGACGW